MPSSTPSHRQLIFITLVTCIQGKWLDVKLKKKQALAAYLKKQWGFDIDPTTMFDMHIKRIHEYAPTVVSRAEKCNVLGEGTRGSC